MTIDTTWLTARPIAHRGLHDMNRTCWENTTTAFDRAIAKGYAIECDVQATSDGQAVVFHDYDLHRLTGEEGNVRDRTAKELTKLAIGNTRDRVTTLSEMLELVAGRVPIIIELKGFPGHDQRLVAAVAAALEHYSGQAAVMSFAHWLVREFPASFPGRPKGLVAEGIKPTEIEAHFSMLANGLDFVSFDVKSIPNPFVDFVRSRLAMPVITWTVRDQHGVDLTHEHADQMTFEGFGPALSTA